ncbi:GATA-type zinc finger protein 1 [Thunnus albacares]|uniref:GATA-type zinc finger protein 1 n=1 Tax=Thunnus albacares TaxID=8236 RepID=UPI001CF6B8D8|nr:GATA-type zinc finger protein 1 [Thunnus albacares]XP_044201842.1 GATA-type zinc finger protein 1 [Thunnus albacares]XP_044201843.1 GATA-type zinc finger protein 1 [Thunnus albacares]
MSTGQETQAAFFQGNQSTVEQDASQSALFYLFQEVNKLAPPIHNSFLNTDSLSTWLNETSRQDHFRVKREEEHAHSFQTSNSSCQHSLSRMSPYNKVKKGKQESQSSKVITLVEEYPECNSPWKVLTLINLQCERLMHQRDVEELDTRSVSSTTKLGYSIAKSLTAAADVTAQGVGGDCVSVEHTLRPSVLICERQEITSGVGPVNDVRGDSSGGDSSYKPHHCMKDFEVCCSVQAQIPEETNTVRPELMEENAPHRDKKKVKMSNRQSEQNQESKKGCFSAEQDIFNLPFSENALLQTHILNASIKTQLTFNSNEDVSVTLSKPTLILDYNANLALTTELPCDTQLTPPSSVLPSSQSASLSFSTAESRHSLSKQDEITSSQPECSRAPTEEKSPPVAQLKSSNYQGQTNLSPSETIKPEPRPVQKEETEHYSTQHRSSECTWRTKTPRKQPNPSRSADIQDPDFQGVTFRMDTELDDSKEQCRLLITSKYSKELYKSVRKPRLRTRTSQKSLKTSSSDEESDLTNTVAKGKICASCCTRKTPMWRDAEDGTPLCNACGIRYKKYRVRCVNCWHIPRKEGNSNSCCLKCGNFVRLTSAQRKHTT